MSLEQSSSILHVCISFLLQVNDQPEIGYMNEKRFRIE